MKKSGVKRKNKKRTIRDLSGLALLCCLLVSVVGITLAFFFSSDYASNWVGLSGPVNIEAVGRNGQPIEDIEATEDSDKVCRLVIDLSDGFSTIIPGMPISLTTNCKVYKSDTKPLLRAKFDLKIYKDSETTPGEQEEVLIPEVIEFSTDMKDTLHTAITASDNWLLYESDGYYYYKGENIIQATAGETELQPIIVDQNDEFRIIDFLNGQIIFPTEVDKTMSGYYFHVSVTFEAIQDFIPNDKGVAMDNTIDNAKLIFDDTWEGIYGQAEEEVQG